MKQIKILSIALCATFLMMAPVKAQLDGTGIAPDFRLSDIDGVEHDLYEYLDQGKVVVIDFFAVWCSICKADAPYLHEVYNGYGPTGTNQIVMLSLEGDNSSTDDQTRDFALEFGSGNPYINNTEDVPELYNLNGYPTYYVIAPDRSYKIIGGRQETMRQQMIEAILAAPPLRTVENDVRVLRYASPIGSICENYFYPRIRIQNYGKNEIVGLQIETLIDGDLASVYPYVDTLAPYNIVDLRLPWVANVPSGWHEIEFRFVDVNGQEDGDPLNGLKGGDFLILPDGDQITVSLTTDPYPKETSWKIYQTGKVVADYSGYTMGLTNYPQDVCVEAGICYKLVIYDSYGDGLSNGGIEISYLGDKIADIQADEFNKDSTAISFCVWPLSASKTELTSDISVDVFPNPGNGEFMVKWKANQGVVSKLIVTNLTGSIILSRNLQQKQNNTVVNLSNSPNGIYFVRLITTYGPLIQKVIVSH